MTIAEQNKLSELTHTLKFVEGELKKAEEELRQGKNDPSTNIREISERYCILVKERHRCRSMLDSEIDKLFESLEHEE
jgi:predicted  nucleic acid-binding Zn-ribbon protein